MCEWMNQMYKGMKLISKGINLVCMNEIVTQGDEIDI